MYLVITYGEALEQITAARGQPGWGGAAVIVRPGGAGQVVYLILEDRHEIHFAGIFLAC